MPFWFAKLMVVQVSSILSALLVCCLDSRNGCTMIGLISAFMVCFLDSACTIDGSIQCLFG